MEDRRYFESSKYDELEYYDRLLTQYLNALYSVVFRKDLKDEYIKIRDIRKEFLEEVESIRGHFEKILELIRKSIKPDIIEDYLQEECSITHLVFTNNIYPKIKLYSIVLCFYVNFITKELLLWE